VVGCWSRSQRRRPSLSDETIFWPRPPELSTSIQIHAKLPFLLVYHTAPAPTSSQFGKYHNARLQHESSDLIWSIEQRLHFAVLLVILGNLG